MSISALIHRFSRFQGHNLPSHVAQHLGHGFHLVVCCITHGEETGSLPAALSILEGLADGSRRFSGTLTVILGNVAAARAGLRFLEADLNRVFLPGPDSHERRRAAALMPVLESADLVIDLHQTICPTAQPFHIHPWSPALERWARVLQGAQDWVSRPLGESFAAGTCCLDEYVRNQGQPALTIELSQKGISPQATARALGVFERAMAAAEALESGRTLTQLAHGQPPMRIWRTTHKQAYSSPKLRLLPGLRNFEPVVAGQLLTAPGSPALIAPCDGVLLFPKYPPRDAAGQVEGPLPAQIFRVLTRLEGHPVALGWPT